MLFLQVRNVPLLFNESLSEKKVIIEMCVYVHINETDEKNF